MIGSIPAIVMSTRPTGGTCRRRRRSHRRAVRARQQGGAPHKGRCGPNARAVVRRSQRCHDRGC